MNKIPVKKEEVIAKNVSGEMVLLIPSTGRYFGLNAVGTGFWEMMDGVKTLEEIAAAMSAKFAVDPAIVTADLQELTAKLSENYLIELK